MNLNLRRGIVVIHPSILERPTPFPRPGPKHANNTRNQPPCLKESSTKPSRFLPIPVSPLRRPRLLWHIRSRYPYSTRPTNIPGLSLLLPTPRRPTKIMYALPRAPSIDIWLRSRRRRPLRHTTAMIASMEEDEDDGEGGHAQDDDDDHEDPFPVR